MQFSEKLDFLMNITKTTNSALSIHTRIDASHISRLRRGQRGALKDTASIKTMAVYFARHCDKDYQQKAVCDAINAKPFESDDDQLSALIARWLSEDNFTARQWTPHFYLPEKSPKESTAAVSAFYGIDGKRQAVIHFLTEVLMQSNSNTLLLFSDEPTDWMTANREFALKLASLMLQVLEKGNKIKIIHTINRDLDEMLKGIHQWMPLYMTGAIEPYYYPKKRDGIFKQTMFIVPNLSAVISRSVGNMLDQAANLYFRDKKAVKAYENEYQQFLSICKPLMQIFTSQDEQTYFSELLEFEKVKSDSIIKTESLSLVTMPESAACSISSRITEKGKILLEYRKRRINLLHTFLKTNHFSEIICLPNLNTLLACRITVASSDMLSGGAAYYTPEEYLLHLEHLVVLLNSYDNFHVYLSADPKEEMYMIYAKEDTGAIVAKTSAPPVALAINEGNMTAAFWDFLKSMIAENTYLKPNNAETLKNLTDYINQLRHSIYS